MPNGTGKQRGQSSYLTGFRMAMPIGTTDRDRLTRFRKRMPIYTGHAEA